MGGRRVRAHRRGRILAPSSHFLPSPLWEEDPADRPTLAKRRRDGEGSLPLVTLLPLIRHARRARRLLPQGEKGRQSRRNLQTASIASYPAHAGYPVRREFSISSRYWIVRSSRTMTDRYATALSRHEVPELVPQRCPSTMSARWVEGSPAPAVSCNAWRRRPPRCRPKAFSVTPSLPSDAQEESSCASP